MAQATDRAHRHEQTNHVHAYYLIGKGTIEESICKKIQVKQQICDEVLDGIQGDSSLNLHNQLLEELRQEAKE
jgi:SNF2 family DNA or RNA helicase